MMEQWTRGDLGGGSILFKDDPDGTIKAAVDAYGGETEAVYVAISSRRLRFPTRVATIFPGWRIDDIAIVGEKHAAKLGLGKLSIGWLRGVFAVHGTDFATEPPDGLAVSGTLFCAGKWSASDNGVIWRPVSEDERDELFSRRRRNAHHPLDLAFLRYEGP